MSERLRRTASIRLAADLAALNASEFEVVGHMLVSAVEGQSLVHRGLNPQAKPVGYASGQRKLHHIGHRKVHHPEGGFTVVRCGR